MNKPQQQESWEDEIYSINLGVWDEQGNQYLNVPSQELKVFIARAISTERQRVLEEVRELVEGMVKTENAQEDQSVADSVYFNQQQNIGYNNALDDLLSALKEMKDKTL